MASRDNAYSRFIALARIVLPLAALGLLSTLFLLSRGTGPGADLPYARVDVEELIREQRIGAPKYAGVTADGTAIAVTADTARPRAGEEGQATAETLRARLDLPDGSHTDIVAATGAVDMQAGQAVLAGGVEIETSTGYRVETERLTTELNATHVVTEGGVEAEGPPGRITAGRMRLDADPAAPGRYLLVFNGGVKLVYEPVQ